MNVSREQIDKLIVGSDDVSFPDGGPDVSPTGTAVLNGPVYIGKPTASPNYDAVLNVGTQPPRRNSLDRQPPMSTPLGIKLDGSMEIVGDGRVPNALRISGGQLDKLYVDGDAFFSGAVDCGNKGKLASRFAAADASPKPFDLVHPTKGEGHRLRYACIEGPEVAVYYRGRLKESNVINLPDYWKDLVHADSITVQLQPIGRQQNLIVEEFDNEYIVIAEDLTNTDLITGLSTIDCFYHVYGERKDINPLIVEYKGDTWEDYPDPNYDPNKVDSDNKNTKDPRFDGPPNTFTK
tara:strand:- start:130 stop:1008 length:879 start_codon:yes stop_codon:yes gene_type:complete